MSDTMSEEKNVEYIREFNETITRAIVAYVNTDGGKIYVGLDEFGKVNGVAEPEDVVAQIETLARTRVKPDPTPFIECKVETLENKKVVVAHILRGLARPYWLVDQGLTPLGALVREDNRTVSPSSTRLQGMIDEACESRYEDARCYNQNLTFQYATQVFERAKYPFVEETFYELGLYDAAGTYTNLALLLSDQCPSTMKFAVFEGTRENQLHDRLELSGSIFQQYDDAYGYLDHYNRSYTRLHGANRGDFRDYPPEILREVLLNAIMHRDYSRDYKTIIRRYHDHLEVVSYGGLPSELDFDEILLGVSVPRNKKLANVFYQLQFVETCGVGIQKIRQAYDAYTLKPKLEASRHFFKATLFHAYSQQLERRPVKDSKENVSVARYAPVKVSIAPVEEPQPKPRPRATIGARDAVTVDARRPEIEPTASVRRYNLSDRERLILQMFNTRDALTCRDVERELNLSQASAAAILRRLVNSGRIVLCGAGNNIWYRRP
ncbi:MAG: putative DNA binding domain-containing protein [Thermoguttaceae bacterium]|nr:putative DNA binding domain-containing protein [Thermoguttaceae bacterium]